MRGFVFILVVVAITIALGAALCVGVGGGLNARAMLVAAGVAIVAGGLAQMPLRLARGAGPAAMAQAALVGSLVHLLVCIGTMIVVVIGKLPVGTGFVYWLGALYFVTLIVLTSVFAKAMKQAPTSGNV
jgi:hypothetical protein